MQDEKPNKINLCELYYFYYLQEDVHCEKPQRTLKNTASKKKRKVVHS